VRLAPSGYRECPAGALDAVKRSNESAETADGAMAELARGLTRGTEAKPGGKCQGRVRAAWQRRAAEKSHALFAVRLHGV